MIELKNVRKVYKTKVGDTAALNGLNLVLPDTGLIFITGKSGSGKTTLLNVVGALDGIDEGDIIVEGKSFSEFSTQEYSDYRNTFVGFIFQEYNLLPNYTIEKNIKIANELQGRPTTQEEIDDLLKLVGLEGLGQRRPSQLSGGQMQRVAIARALIKQPKLIMADEPTGALDQATGIQIMQTLKSLSKNNLVVVVSHDLEIAEKFADRIIRLVDGTIAEDFTLTDKEISSNIIENDDIFTVKNGADLSQNETQILIQAIRDKKKIQFSESLSVRSRSVTKKIKAVHPENPEKFVSSKMKMKSAFGLGLNSLGSKPIRLIFTILLSVFAFALFGVFDTVGAFSDSRAIAQLLRDNTYSSITASATWTNDGHASTIKTSQNQINKLNKETGYNFRGLYEIDDDNPNGITSNPVRITQYTHKPTLPGSQYYLPQFTDFVEFDKSEMNIVRDSKGNIGPGTIIDKNGFNAKILYGTYPIYQQQNGDVLYGGMFSPVAISSYTAQSIMYWINKGTVTLNGINGKIDSVEQLIGKSFGLGTGTSCEIRAIIDCGDVPEKYNPLKDSISNETYSLHEDFNTWLNSGLHLKIFVSTGYIKDWQRFNNRSQRYFTSSENTSITYNGLDSCQQGSDIAFFNTKDFVGDTHNRTLLFTPRTSTEIGVTSSKPLAKNEILIDARDMYLFYKDEINLLNSDKITASEQEYNDLKASLNVTRLELTDKKLFTELTHKYIGDNSWNTDARVFNRDISQRQDALEYVKNMFATNNLSLEKEVEIKQVDRYTGAEQFCKVKIVGVFFGINAKIYQDNYPDRTAFERDYSLPVMMTPALLNELGVCNAQGEFSRMISPINTGYFATQKLAEKFIAKDGFSLSWYKNSILETINSNNVIDQLSNIFLYVSLALAVFSVFMLFNYISTSIISKKQSIGILRGLGSNSRDIFRIFIIESLVIAIINGLLACGVAYVGCLLVNMYIQTKMNFTISFALFGFRQVIIMMLGSIVTAVLASLVPIIRICKQKPVDLIKRP